MESDEVRRFTLELEFVQCLGNPKYLQFLAQSGYFSEEAFILYLKYLKYWQTPKYSPYIIFPNCLWILDLLQDKNFRAECANPAFREMLILKLRDYQKSYGKLNPVLKEHQPLEFESHFEKYANFIPEIVKEDTE